MAWYVLACPEGYLGNAFENYNGSSRRPRYAIVDLQEASLFFGETAISEGAKRGFGILGLDFKPVKVKIEGQGEKAKVCFQEIRK